MLLFTVWLIKLFPFLKNAKIVSSVILIRIGSANQKIGALS